jgi:glyoxylase-like metal-dependent hydrolase (beta-lactamase superfamily II)
MTIVGALLTHFHVDHCGGIPPPPFDKFRIRVDGLAKLLKKIPDIKAFINEHEIPKVLEGNPDFPVERISPTTDQQTLQLPFNQFAQHPTKIKFIHTPGHTPGSQCFLVNDKRLISGDTLFVGSCGRTDFPESNVSQMFHSLKEKLCKLSDSIVVYPGHDYGGEFTTILREKSGGVLGMSEEQFMKIFEQSC